MSSLISVRNKNIARCVERVSSLDVLHEERMLTWRTSVLYNKAQRCNRVNRCNFNESI